MTRKIYTIKKNFDRMNFDYGILVEELEEVVKMRKRKYSLNLMYLLNVVERENDHDYCCRLLLIDLPNLPKINNR